MLDAVLCDLASKELDQFLLAVLHNEIPPYGRNQASKRQESTRYPDDLVVKLVMNYSQVDNFW